PASPQIFHGRDSELNEIVAALMKEAPRVAVLGSGGMGKTTLALAALHHADVKEKYPTRHFVSCESANSAGELVSSVGSYLNLPPSQGLSKAIYGHFLDRGPTILVLDNLETPWEPLSARAPAEEFLSLLADVPHLALLITMRGAERPGKVKWSRPFLAPLEPISTLAARQTFIDIAEEPTAGDEAALDDLIDLTGNLPLAVALMANIASYEGYLGALTRWKTENTALLSEGYDKRSSLDASISMSLSSPRINSNPHALDLLSLLSLLPDGISEEELVSSKVPLPKISECISSLRRTSLAFMSDRRLKTLAPIRDYIRRAHPASAALTQPLLSYLLALLRAIRSSQVVFDVFPQLTSHLGNITSVLSYLLV
ncbi:P-loop containing nucleoside triphosphate hydrolase protein, partial [Mycena vulgaris]